MATKNESADIGTAKPKCGARVLRTGGYRNHECGKTATHEHSGAHYCKTHHPPNVKAKQEAKRSKLDAEFSARMVKVKAADDELASLRKAVRSGEGEWIGHDELAAMRKDAARYLKLRDRTKTRLRVWLPNESDGGATGPFELLNLDAALDAE